MVAFVLSIILQVLCLGCSDSGVQVYYLPAIEREVIDEDVEWDEFWSDSFYEHLDLFDSIFNDVEVKRSKNNRIMTKSIYSPSFKFAPKGK